MAQTVEELEAQRAAKEKELEVQVAAAGVEAKAEAEAKGATPEEVKAAVEKARQEEKDKLYPQLDALKESIKEIQQALRDEREEKEQIKRDAEAEKERQRLAKLSDSEKTLEAIRKLEEQLRASQERQIDLERRQTERERSEELRRYKEAQIKAAGDEIIPELVFGKSEAEIDRAVDNAKARYAELTERIKAETGVGVRSGMPRPTSPGTEALEEEELDERLTQVDQDKYLSDPVYRRQIQDELANAYERAAGRR